MASISFSGYQDCNTWNSWQTNSITSDRSFGYTRKTGSKADYRLLLRVTLKADANSSIDSFSVCLNIYPSAGAQNPNPSKSFGVEGYLYDNENVLKTNLLNPPGGYISYAAESSAIATTRAGRKFTITFSNVHCTSTTDKYYYIWVGGIATSDAWLMEFWGGTGCSVAIVSTSILAGTWRKPLSLAWSPTKSSNGYYSGLRAIDQKFTISVPSGYYAYGSQNNNIYYRKSNLIYDAQTSMTDNSILRYASCNSVNTNEITASLSSIYYQTIYIPRLCFSGFFDKEYCINTMQYCNSNSKITAPSISGLSGWVFLGYRTSTSAPTSDSVNYTTWATSSPNNIALYGLLKKILTFNPNGGSSNGSTNSKTYTEYKYGTNSGLSTTGNYNYAVSRTGYTFSCWTDSDGDEYSSMADAFERADSGSTLVAVWAPAVQTNIIDHWSWGFKNQEGNNGDRKDAFKLAETTFSANTNSTINLTENYKTTIPNGFSFNPFVGTSSVTGSWENYPLPYSTSQKPNSMSFEYDYIPTVWTITYNLNGGTNHIYNPTDYTVLYGVTFTEPTKYGYNFSHWTDSNNNTITGINPGANATFSSAADLYSKLSNRIARDYVVTAHWTPKQTNINLQRQGGTGGPSSVTAIYDSPMPTITPPTKYGYQFLGYYDSSSGGNQYYKSDGTSFQNWNRDNITATLYARWQDSSSNLILDPQGGIEGTLSVTAIQNSPMPTITPPVREGYQFLGYFDTNNVQYYNMNGSSARNWDKTGSQTLYAHWEFQGMHLYQSGWKTIVPYIYFGDIIYEQTTSIANQTTPYQYHIEEAKNNISIIDTYFSSGVSGDPYITENSSNPTSHLSDFNISTAGSEVFVDVKAGAKFTIGTYNYTLNWGSNSLSFQIISQASAWKRVLPYVYYNNNWQPSYNIGYSPFTIITQSNTINSIPAGSSTTVTVNVTPGSDNITYEWLYASQETGPYTTIPTLGRPAMLLPFSATNTTSNAMRLTTKATNNMTSTYYFRCRITDGTTIETTSFYYKITFLSKSAA